MTDNETCGKCGRERAVHDRDYQYPTDHPFRPAASPDASGGVTLGLVLDEAAGLLDASDPNPGNGEYRRAMVELACRSFGLSIDDYRAAIDGEIAARLIRP